MQCFERLRRGFLLSKIGAVKNANLADLPAREQVTALFEAPLRNARRVLKPLQANLQGGACSA
jgi:hypothetical protein